MLAWSAFHVQLQGKRGEKQSKQSLTSGGGLGCRRVSSQQHTIPSDRHWGSLEIIKDQFY